MIRVAGLEYAIGCFQVHADLEVRESEYFVLLGMTGSGKTLLLENLCGLRACAKGRVEVNGRDITNAEPRERRIGYVPQDGALFEHLSVRRNIGFSLELRGISRPERDGEIESMAGLLKIPHLLDRRIRGLSGGERQRVALARALISRPEALILDEPVSALDEFTRQAVCNELRNLQRRVGIPVIHVCHSFEEARLVGDRIGIMHQGRVIRVGTPEELMNDPALLAVAQILRLDNVFEGTAQRGADGRTRISCGDVLLNGPEAEGAVRFYIRPWEIGFDDSNRTAFDNEITTSIAAVIRSGAFVQIKTAAPLLLSLSLSVREFQKAGLSEGLSVRLRFPREAVRLLNA